MKEYRVVNEVWTLCSEPTARFGNPRRFLGWDELVPGSVFRQ